MSRRDTIIIALLINAGVLAIMFMLAVNVDDDAVQPSEKAPSMSMDKPQKEIVSAAPMTEISVNDEVDTFLKELKTGDTSQSSYVDDEDHLASAEKDSSDQPLPPDPSSKIVPATAKADQGNVSYIEVKVKSGDVLEKIAKNNGTTVEAIKLANNLTSTKLNIGQVLKIPTQNKVTSAPVAKPAAKPSTATLTPAPKIAEKTPVVAEEAQYYTVKSGDSPWKIAKEMGISVEELLRLNGLDEAKARNLKVGEKIRVR